MQNKEINTPSDLYDMLDNFTGSISWEEFYEKWDQPAPFLLYNQTPDQFLIEFLQNHTVQNALEFGCGEGRNAIYLAQHGVFVEAYDRAANAIEKAREFAAEKKQPSISIPAISSSITSRRNGTIWSATAVSFIIWRRTDGSSIGIWCVPF